MYALLIFIFFVEYKLNFCKENLTTVPQRYIQPQHQDMVLISEEDHSTLEIPVIDMHRLLSVESGSSELDKLHLACKEWGFFQVYFISLSFKLILKCIIHILISVGFWIPDFRCI